MNEPALLVASGGWPRDWITWAKALPEVIFICVIAGGTAGIGVFAIAFLLTQSLEWATLFGSIGVIAMCVSSTRTHHRISNERQTFYDDRVVADLANVEGDDRSGIESYQIPYDQIGTVMLCPKHGSIRFWFAQTDPTRRDSFEMRSTPLLVRDHFDMIVQRIEDSFPDHLFVRIEDGRREYSRPWTLEEVVPDHPSVRGDFQIESIRPETDIRQRARAHIALDERTVVFRSSTPETIQVIDDANPEAPRWSSYRSDADSKVGVIATNGLEVAHFELDRTDDTIFTHLGPGSRLIWDTRRFQVRLDDQLVGVFRKHEYGATLQLSRPMAESLVIVLFLMAFATRA